MIETAIKIGGSMGQSPKLEHLMMRLSEFAGRHRILVIPGGGAFADAIRYYDRRFGLDADASHWMAILAMDQYGHLLASLAPNIELVQGLADAHKVLSEGRIPILLTYNLLFQTDELPRSWDVTSDSIAAWVAGICGARQLILLKSVDGLFTDNPTVHATAKVLERISLTKLAICGGVDSYIGSVLKKNGVEAWVINGNYPNRLTQLLDTGDTLGTHVLKSNIHLGSVMR